MVGSAFLGSAVPLRHLSNPSQYPNSSNEMSASMLIVSKMAAAISPAPNTCVCMKTQTRWLMRLPLPALMALIFSSAERSHGLRCQMLFCSPPFTGLAHATRAAARERFTSCFMCRAWWIHSFEEVTLQNESEVRFYSRHPSRWNINEGICKRETFRSFFIPLHYAPWPPSEKVTAHTWVKAIFSQFEFQWLCNCNYPTCWKSHEGCCIIQQMAKTLGFWVSIEIYHSSCCFKLTFLMFPAVYADNRSGSFPSVAEARSSTCIMFKFPVGLHHNFQRKRLIIELRNW